MDSPNGQRGEERNGRILYVIIPLYGKTQTAPKQLLLKADATMQYVTSCERLAAQDAKVENARQFILRALNLRFGQVPPPITELVEAIDGLEVLELLHDKAVTISSLDMFEDIVSGYQQ